MALVEKVEEVGEIGAVQALVDWAVVEAVDRAVPHRRGWMQPLGGVDTVSLTDRIDRIRSRRRILLRRRSLSLERGQRH